MHRPAHRSPPFTRIPPQRTRAQEQGWPTEGKLRHLPPAERSKLGRSPLPLHALAHALHRRNEQLESVDAAPLAQEEIIAGRLYTGPCYCKYNAVLRGSVEGAKLDAHKQFVELCHTNVYATTLHAINSAITKLSKIQQVAKVYRGIRDGVLPSAFWEPNDMNVRGGVEFAFMSTSLDAQVAMAYARGGDGGASLVFEIQMGMVDRGADLSWLSQYPLEREILFAPLTGLEVQGTRVEDSTLVVEVKLSVNMRSLTIEDVVAKMKHSHLQLLDMLRDELEYVGAPLRALTPLVNAREAAERVDGSLYNDPQYFDDATTAALDAQKEVFRLLGDERLWRGAPGAGSAGSSSGGSASDSGSATPAAPTESQRDVASRRPRRLADPARRRASFGTAGSALSDALPTDASDALPTDALLADVARELTDDKALRMRTTAMLCARMRAHDTAIQLLRLSLSASPLAASRPKYAEAVRCVCFAAESVCDEDGRPLHPVGDPWRLEVLMLTEDAMEPWPAMLVHLILETEETYRAGNLVAFASLCKGFHDADRFGIGAPVLVWRQLTNSVLETRSKTALGSKPTESVAAGSLSEGGEWLPGTITRKQFAERCDVSLADGEVVSSVRKPCVLAHDTGGPGAVLREAAAAGSVALLRALLHKSISPFESDLQANTALHFAARSGHAACVEVLVASRADAWMCNKAKITPYDEAVSTGLCVCMRMPIRRGGEHGLMHVHAHAHTTRQWARACACACACPWR